MVATLFILLFVLILISVPLYIVLAGAPLAAFFVSGDILPSAAIQHMFDGIDKFALMAVPFFILAANVMKNGGMAKRMVKLANVLVGGFRGGLAFTAIVACMFFGALCGSSPATVVAIGGIVYQPLLDAGYGRRFSSGLITASAAVALLIPPSINMIIYGVVARVSVGELFMAGFGAGLVYGILFIIYSAFYARRNNIPVTRRPKPKEILIAFKGAMWDLGVAAIIIGGIYGGVFTPTEAAAVSAVYAVFVCMVIHRELDFKGLYRSGLESARITAMVMIMIAAAASLSWALTVGGISQFLGAHILGLTQSPPLIMLMMIVIMLIAGMFMDGSSFTLVLIPLFLPIAQNMGIDLIHLGIITVTAASIGMYTPPFGLNLFVATGVTKCTFEELAKGVWPFILISLPIMLIIAYVPEISLWLPNFLYH